MALTNAYVQVYGQLRQVFDRIAQAQAPSKFTVQYLKDLGFTSSNYRAVIPLLKALGFLSGEGVPTKRYLDYRNTEMSRRVMAAALRDAYGDLFTIRANPTVGDKKLLEGKFKSTHNASAVTSRLMASTFYSLLDMADLSGVGNADEPADIEEKEAEPEDEAAKTRQAKDKSEVAPNPPASHPQRPSLHYNIQIHLPATKDVEVFNAIFKSLRAHLLE
jgi:hypothetical protein